MISQFSSTAAWPTSSFAALPVRRRSRIKASVQAMVSSLLILTSLTLCVVIARADKNINTVRPAGTLSANYAKLFAPTQRCDSSVQNTSSTQFDLCPSLRIDFAAMPDGPLSQDKFNIFYGNPKTNDEPQYYTNSLQNIRIHQHLLELRAFKQAMNGYLYTSARIDTQGKSSFMYGKIIVRATLPSSRGSWPAIWLLPADNKYARLGPQIPNRDLSDGEIDIAEGAPSIAHRVDGVTHTLAFFPPQGQPGYYDSVIVPDGSSVFHDYGLEWTPSSLNFTLDGHSFFTYNKQPGATYYSWPFDQNFYLIINLALLGGEDNIDTSALPATMKVQSIAYYPYNELGK